MSPLQIVSWEDGTISVMNFVRAKRGSSGTNRKALWKKATTASLAMARFKAAGKAKRRASSKSPPPTKAMLEDEIEVSKSAIAEWKDKRRSRRVTRIENAVEEVRVDVSALKREMAEFTTEMRGMAQNIMELCARLEAV